MQFARWSEPLCTSDFPEEKMVNSGFNPSMTADIVNFPDNAFLLTTNELVKLSLS